MKFEKLIYVILSTILITTLILVSYISFPLNFQGRDSSSAKKIYYVDNISKAHQKVIEKFNQRYKGQIEVIPINLPFEKFSTNERKELLARFLRSRSDRIDIFAVDQIWVPRFAKWGIPLDKYAASVQKENLLSYAMQSCSYKNELVALPLYIDIALMYYRKDFLKSLPDYEAVRQRLENSITWEEFVSLYKRMPYKNQPYFTFQANDFEGLMCIFVEMLSSQNSSLMKGDSLNINTPEARKALQLLVDMVNEYNVSPREVIKFREDPSYTYFLNNEGVFLRGWPSFLNQYEPGQVDSKNFENIERMPTPHFAGGRAVSVYGGWNLVISRYSTKIPESIIFINYLMSEEAQKALYENGGYLPINIKIYNDPAYVKMHPELKFYKQALSRGVHRPFSERYTNVSDILSYYLNQAIRKKITVDEAISRAENIISSQSILLK